MTDGVLTDEPPGELGGLVAVVTGAAGGIGSAVVSLLRERGAVVVGLDVAVPDLGPADAYVACDVASSESVAEAVRTVARRFGQLDIVVNNAGVGAVGDVTANEDDEWARVLDVNVVGMARVVREALPHLSASAAPAVVNMSSILAALGVPDRLLYSASKGAVSALTLAMAADLVDAGIRVNAVAPGTTDTPWVGRLLAATDDPDRARSQLRDRQPIGRLVTPAEVAETVAYLASPRSGSTTGTVVYVDGGMSGLRLPR